MTTCEWISVQSFLTDLALDQAHTQEEREFVKLRLQELQARVRFEQRQLTCSGGGAPADDPALN